MPTNSQNKHLRELAQLSARIVHSGANAAGVEPFCAQLLRMLTQDAGIRDAVIVHGGLGVWRVVASIGSAGSPPEHLLADAADTEQLSQDRQWRVIPLAVPGDAGWVLGIRYAESEAAAADQLELLTSTIGATLAAVLRMQRAETRQQTLDAMLSMSARWHGLLKSEELLRDIAQSSRDLFPAERATVYLWDRKRRVLVGTRFPSPDGSESITIPDDSGVVGRVIQTGSVVRTESAEMRAARGDDAAGNSDVASNRLLCVPIQGRRGRVLGALELSNKLRGSFDVDDEARLRELVRHAALALENSRADRDSLVARSRQDGEEPTRADLIGQSQPIQELRAKVLRVASSELPVLVLGENGSGKEVVSRMIHENSPRRDKAFVAVNCAALAESLLETELFGHEKGAYTDAYEARPGKFEAATDGTLFLDEIGELSPRAQAQLLRVLDEKAFTRVGGINLVSTNARLITATNRDLARMVQEQKFREDLFFRLNVVTLEVPPLREHAEDILPLANHFMAQFSQRLNRAVPRLTVAAQTMLRNYDWPGNVRELRNLMERSTYLCGADQIDVAELEGLARGGGLTAQVGLELTLSDATREFQIEYIQQQIDAAGGSMTEAARRLGLHRSNLYRKMRQLDMPMDEIEDERWA